ncbi:putative ATPase [Leptomonas seymouri]|uniref:Putative ATPase n=1 Tax=Leptomonas seymouri TaxID=5684 RepID=A0A0N1I9Q8_LEPSE|nr:putative ATPase [Leptomonas seymouri]|eukprot:KPI88830.1 putative ATPase [Leptomonas seymouri]
MACTTSHTDALSRSSDAVTPLSQTRDLLVSLLHWWPYSPHQQCPSILLCGPTSNGKSHLVRRVVYDAHHAAKSGKGEQELVAHERCRRVVAVTPRLAEAVAVQTAKDGSTGLRRLLRRAIQEACADALRGMNGLSSTGGDELVDLAVLLVLDHVECYWMYADEFYMGNGEAASTPATDGNGNGADYASSSSAHGGLNTPYPALLADFYTVLRSAPPLFSKSECETLRLSTLVYLSLFTGELDEVLPTVRQRYVDYTLSLPTPTEAERRTFLQPLTQPAETATKTGADLLPPLLAEALVLRTGGVSYGGLQEIFTLALDSLDDADSESSFSAAAAAQRILHAYLSSGSVTALEYRRSAGYVDVQVTRWDSIAGMSDVKATLQRLVTDPIHHRDTYRRFHVRPSTGVLLYGPPGTGKTMLAKAMATELNASFIYIDLPELVQGEVGESERRLQAYFDVARERSPSLVFMDELQAAFGLRYADTAVKGSRGNRRPSSEVRDPHRGESSTTSPHDARLVSHLLRLLDAAQQDEDHFLLFVGATNAVHLLEPLLLRAGRLDTVLEVPLPDAAARESLVKRVVYGEWSGWFRCESSSDMSAGDAGEAQRLGRIQSALVKEFVRLSGGFSGAQVRNFLSVFALQLARTVSRGDSCAREADERPSEGSSNGAPVTRDAVTQRQRRLQDAITQFLACDDPSGVLSSAAQCLLSNSRAKSHA